MNDDEIPDDPNELPDLPPQESPYIPDVPEPFLPDTPEPEPVSPIEPCSDENSLAILHAAEFAILMRVSEQVKQRAC